MVIAINGSKLILELGQCQSEKTLSKAQVSQSGIKLQSGERDLK